MTDLVITPDQPLTCALLDERDVFIAMVTVTDRAQLTDRHLPQIRKCDRPVGEYKWVKDDAPGNPFGGAFWPLNYLKARALTQAQAARERAGKQRPKR